MKDTLNTLKKQISDMRDYIENRLIGMLLHADGDEINCGEYSNTPVISNDIDTFTLNEIQLCRTMNGDFYILCEGSGEYDNIYIAAKSMDIEYLIAVYEWVIEHIEDLLPDDTWEDSEYEEEDEDYE